MANSPANFVKTCAVSHSTLGLFIAALLYLVCISGSLAVFKDDIERWEQPLAQETQLPPISAIEKSFNEVLNDSQKITEHMYLVFPSESLPRYKIASEKEGWYLNESGEPDASAYTYFADLLSHLHTYLHLPSAIGIYVVSLMGILLSALIISGFLSHPTIIKDAFKWRKQNSARLYETDLHNRLSVWGAPFYLMLAITGAYFGFIGLLLASFAQFEYDGDRQAVITEVFGEEPKLTEQPKYIQLEKIIEAASEIDSGQKLFAVVHDSGTDSQFVELYIQQANRFLYSEVYRFDVNGNYLGSDDYLNGSVGKQIGFSTYRLHFGLFFGFSVKLLYFVLGMCLTVICVTGVNIWLLKRKHQDFVNPLWAAVVWGAPLSIIVAAISSLILHTSSAVGFWLPYVLCMLASLSSKNAAVFKNQLMIANAASAILLLLVHVALFGWTLFSPASILLTVALITYVGVLTYFLNYKNRIGDEKSVSKDLGDKNTGVASS